MDVEKAKKFVNKVNGSLVVFTDIEYRINPSLTDRVISRATCKSGAARSKLILKGACGALRPSRVTFILGPSGAGKSTLLHIIAGRKQEGVSGEVRGAENGVVLVSQHAALIAELTARETLEFAAALKLPRVSKSQQVHAIERVTKLLGINDALDTRNARLSGGERKRLSIACEVLTEPKVLLLDEPTSGLDSVSSVYVIRAIQGVAACGVTVALVLHQPSSKLFAMTHDVILLASGRTLYSGSREDATEVMARSGLVCPQYYNPADFMLEVATGERDGGDLNQLENGARTYAYALSKNRTNDLRNGNTSFIDSNKGFFSKKYAASSPKQLISLLWRGAICAKRDVHVTQLRLAAHVLVALLLGALYSGAGADAARVTTNTACLFFFLLFLFFSNAMPTIHTFPVEAEVVLQEHLNNWYCLVSYCLAKIITDLPVQILCATLFTGPAWFLTSQPCEYWRLGYMWFVCLLLTILAQTFGLVIGAACDVKLGLFVVPAANIPMLMFSGFFIKYHEIPKYLKPFASISYFQYSFDAAIAAVYGFDREKLDCSEPFCVFRYPQKIIHELDIKTDYWGDVLALSIWIILLQVCLILIMLYRIRSACR